MSFLNRKNEQFKTQTRKNQLNFQFSRVRVTFQTESVFLEQQAMQKTLLWLQQPKEQLLATLKHVIKNPNQTDLSCVFSIINNNIFFHHGVLNLTDLENTGILADLVHLSSYPDLPHLDQLVSLLYLLTASIQDLSSFFEMGLTDHLRRIAQTTQDDATLFHCLCIIANMCIDLPKLRVQILETGFMKFIVREQFKLLRCNSKIIKLTLFLMSNVLIEFNEIMLAVYSEQVLFILEFLSEMLGKNSVSYQTGMEEGINSFVDVCSILTGFSETAHFVINNEGIVFKLIQLLLNSKLQIRVCWILGNLVRHVSVDLFYLLIPEESICVYSYCLREFGLSSEILKEYVFLLSNLGLSKHFRFMFLRQTDMLDSVKIFLENGDDELKRDCVILCWNLLIAIEERDVDLFFDSDLLYWMFKRGVMVYDEETKMRLVEGFELFLEHALKYLENSFRFIKEYIIEREIDEKLDYRLDRQSLEMRQIVERIRNLITFE